MVASPQRVAIPARVARAERRACGRPGVRVAQASTASPGGVSSPRPRTQRPGRSMAGPASSGESVSSPRPAVGVAAEASAQHDPTGGRVLSALTPARHPAGPPIGTAPTACTTGQDGMPRRCAVLASRSTRLGRGAHRPGRPCASAKRHGGGARSASAWAALAAPPLSRRGRPGGSMCQLGLFVAAPSSRR